MIAKCPLMAFVYTADPEISRPFYRDTLGLKLLEEHQYAMVFDANGTQLRVGKGSASTPAQHTVLGWEVPDIVSAINELKAAGVTFNRYEGLGQDEQGVWQAPGGAKIAWFRDPDGNVLSLTEFPATTPVL